MAVILRITRTTHTHHRFAYVRDDGSGESADIETKSFLFHDFLHFSLESEARLKIGFFGLLSMGHTLAELNNKEPSEFDRDSAMQVERAVGGLTGITKGATPKEVMDGLRNVYSAEGRQHPEWLTEDCLARSAERYRKLLGQWNSLKFGETIELRFEV